ncbi:tigger transposable element-derived protein 4-like [Schistocerca gregaria]|uniref:tigger transposable element-derived protein 4-like n=1 Tax=Schistocerca gregaria TaxID=7010 RepID=UPI00211E4EF5|nr:tigger transposable element-derived protein 4-like [Schistocerca gregaria]
MILILVDNCPVHPALSGLENVNLVFLPTNMTSLMQPIAQRLIQCLKCHCHTLILMKKTQSIEKKQDYSVTMVDVIRCVTKARCWVTVQTIKKCFNHVGITDEGINAIKTEDTFNDTDDLLLSELLPENCDILNQCDYEIYATIEDDLVTAKVEHKTKLLMKRRIRVKVAIK